MRDENEFLGAPPGRRRRCAGLWSVARSWNVVSLAIVLVLAGHADVLFEELSPRASSVPQGFTRSAAGVTLVVVDALRADVASDPRRMPELCRLAGASPRATALVESVVPSTVAGIRVLTEGRVPGAASFLEDFRARRSADDGIFGRLRDTGRRAFVSGPRLWTDLHGDSIDASFVAATLAASDDAIESAALTALRSGEHALVVVHLWALDEIAHREGFGSSYLEGARRIDRSIARLVEAAPDRAVVVTSDHGVTRSGGHAGPERAVLEIPLVVHADSIEDGSLTSLSRSPPLAQRDVFPILCALLGVDRTPPAPGPRVTAPGFAAGLLAGLLAILALARHRESRWRTTIVDIGLWSALVALFLTHAMLAITLGVCALAAPLLGEDSRRWRRSLARLAVTAACGLALGWARLRSWPMDGEGVVVLCAALGLLAGAGVRSCSSRKLSTASSPGRGGDEPPGPPPPAGLARLVRREATLLPLYALGWALSGPMLAVALAFARAVGCWLASLARETRAVERVALASSVSASAVAWIAGDGVSLSSIDVRAAFSLADSWLGIPAAATLVTARQLVLPLVLGLPVARAWWIADRGILSRGLATWGAVAIGASLAASLFLGSSDTAETGIGLGLALRAFAEASGLFLAAAIAATLASGSRRRNRDHVATQ